MEEKQETIEIVEVKKDRTFAKGVMIGILSATCVFLILGAAGIFWLQGRVSTGSGTGGKSIVDSSVRAKINELTGAIRQYYYEDVDTQKLTDGLYKGLFASLDDPYSAYYTEEEYKEMMISASAQYYGIGVALQQEPRTMRVSIVRVYEKTPAQQAGLKADDVIIRVDDIDARSMELSELVNYIRGEKNTTVRLVVQRLGEPEYMEFDVKRDKVDVPTVDSRMLRDDIGYIAITEFGEATAKDFENQVEQLQRQGMKMMIVDLRNNPGGMLNSVTEVLDYLLPEGLLFYTEDKYGNREETFSDSERCLTLPMAVLINGNSASCSEIFAGAIRDHDYGTLIGTTTFGKGVVQTVRPLTDKSAIKITTAKYYTPKGENIHGTGIRPDIELKYKYSGSEDEKYDYEKDNQVMRAVKELKKEK